MAKASKMDMGKRVTKTALHNGTMNDGDLKMRCVEGQPNSKVRIAFMDGKSKDGTPMPALPEIPKSKYSFDGGKVKGQ